MNGANRRAGFGKSHIRSNSFTLRRMESKSSTIVRSCVVPWIPDESGVRSYPAEKARPAPRITSTRTSGSLPRSSRAAANPRSTPWFKAFNLCGRFSVTHPTLPRRSTRTSSPADSSDNSWISYHDKSTRTGSRVPPISDQLLKPASRTQRRFIAPRMSTGAKVDWIPRAVVCQYAALTQLKGPRRS